MAYRAAQHESAFEATGNFYDIHGIRGGRRVSPPRKPGRCCAHGVSERAGSFVGGAIGARAARYAAVSPVDVSTSERGRPRTWMNGQRGCNLGEDDSRY